MTRRSPCRSWATSRSRAPSPRPRGRASARTWCSARCPGSPAPTWSSTRARTAPCPSPAPSSSALARTMTDPFYGIRRTLPAAGWRAARRDGAAPGRRPRDRLRGRGRRRRSTVTRWGRPPAPGPSARRSMRSSRPAAGRCRSAARGAGAALERWPATVAVRARRRHVLRPGRRSHTLTATCRRSDVMATSTRPARRSASRSSSGSSSRSRTGAAGDRTTSSAR